jgi:hypothetical protein
LGNDPHFQSGCTPCHKGDEKAQTKETAHKGLIGRPSDNLALCGECHGDITKKYARALHYTGAGQLAGVAPRFSKHELQAFQKKVFEQSCRSCHASCGDCHVKSPIIAGVNLGLLKGHKFVKRDEGRTCALCHGGRVYPEFTGEYGTMADVHYQKGMMCLDCHKTDQLHGDGSAYTSRMQVRERPRCVNCHKTGGEQNEKARSSHATHNGKVSCVACHSAGVYRNCQDCHIGKGATSKPGFILGRNPRALNTVTTLRLIPAVRDTFKSSGIDMSHYDSLPNYYSTSPHNIRKRTERTRSCSPCHIEKEHFLTKETLVPGGSKANTELLYSPKPINK